MTEEWRVVAEAPEYMVSNMGQIKSIYTNRPLVGGIDKDGYRKLVMCSGGRRIHRRICALVCEAFHGPRPTGMVSRHLNGLCSDDRADNLAWSTQAVNIGDKVAHGTAQIGERHGRALLNDDLVRYIRNSPTHRKVIAAELGVSVPCIDAVRARRNWRHVE